MCILFYVFNSLNNDLVIHFKCNLNIKDILPLLYKFFGFIFFVILI